jgi:hypothetical protein
VIRSCELGLHRRDSESNPSSTPAHLHQGVKVSDKDITQLDIHRDSFHGAATGAGADGEFSIVA